MIDNRYSICLLNASCLNARSEFMQSRIYPLKLSICSAFLAVSMSNDTCFWIRIDTGDMIRLCIGVDRIGEKIGKSYGQYKSDAGD